MNNLNASEIIHYSIPQTQIRLVIYTGATISSRAMRNTLESCILTANTVMGKHGNVYMFPDPCIFTTPPKLHTGLRITADSTMVPGLKWVDLIRALTGVEQIVALRALYKNMHVKMYDAPSGVEMGVVDLYTSPAVSLANHGGPA